MNWNSRTGEVSGLKPGTAKAIAKQAQDEQASKVYLQVEIRHRSDWQLVPYTVYAYLHRFDSAEALEEFTATHDDLAGALAHVDVWANVWNVAGIDIQVYTTGYDQSEGSK